MWNPVTIGALIGAVTAAITAVISAVAQLLHARNQAAHHPKKGGKGP